MNYDDLPDYNDNILIRHDLTIWGTIVIISNLAQCKIRNKEPFDLNWFYFSLSILRKINLNYIKISEFINI